MRRARAPAGFEYRAGPFGPLCTRNAAVLLAGLLLAACAPTSVAPTDEDAITVLAASSLQSSFRRLAESVRPAGLEITFGFAGSARLAAQVREGVAADVVATADEETLAGLARSALLAGRPVVFATNRLAIAVRPGNPDGVHTLADLGRPGLDVVLAAPAVPAGRYAAEALRTAGVTAHPLSLEDSVAAVAARVARGEADAGVVYVTDTKGRPGVEAVAIPAGQNVTARYPIAVLAASSHGAAARRFVRFVTSPAGRRVLAGAGFGPP